jgi:hypothetical protein
VNIDPWLSKYVEKFTSCILYFSSSFSAKQLLTDLDLDPVYVTVGPAIAAILTVNGIVMLYVISALKQEAKEKEAFKLKES